MAYKIFMGYHSFLSKRKRTDSTPIIEREHFSGTLTSHSTITRYGEVVEDVANLSAPAGFAEKYIPFPNLNICESCI
jgi:hypothetical protein